MNRRQLLVPLSLVLVLVLAVALSAGCGKKAPVISSITPASGEAGSSVKIAGKDFGAEQDSSSVEFGTVSGVVSSWSDTAISAKVPPDLKAGKYEVTVKTSGGTSSAADFEVKEAGKSDQSSPSSSSPSSATATPEEVIVEYYKSEGTSMQTSAGTATPKLFKQSQSDPDWALWYVFWGEGTDADVLLLHKADGKWTVVTSSNGSMDSTPSLNPQDNGAPSDLTWDGWPPQ